MYYYKSDVFPGTFVHVQIVSTVTSGSNFLFLLNSYYHSGLKYMAALFPMLHADPHVELSTSKTLQQSNGTNNGLFEKVENR